MRKRILRIIEKNRNEVRGILLRKYPAFIRSDRAKPPSVPPVFVFHEVRRPVVEALLRFLADNAYATLTADQYAERVGQRGRDGNREVVLTFDDGLKSLHEVVYPALRRFNLKAVAYVVTGRVPEESRPDRLLCNWKEIREMHGSGAVDFQSHSVLHDSIAVSERVVDFVNPVSNLSFLDGDLAPVAEGVPRLEDRDELPLGTPIHDWGTRFGERRAFRESPSAVRACLEHVARCGGPEFFRQQGWRKRLGSVVREVRRSAGGARFETEEEQQAAILGEMADSKREIEARIPGKTVRHFCFPWFRGSRLAIRLSARAGYVTNSWGSLLPDFAAGVRTPIPVERLPYWYIWRLPGRGRRSIGEILRERWSEIWQGRYANH